jgi:hypothetical protein
MTNGTNGQGLKETIDLDSPVFTITSNVRILNALSSENIGTLRELCAQSHAYLLRIPNFGRKSLIELQENLAEHDLSLSHVFSIYKADVPVSQPNQQVSFEKYKTNILNQLAKDAKEIDHLPIVDKIAKLKLIQDIMLTIESKHK